MFLNNIFKSIFSKSLENVNILFHDIIVKNIVINTSDGKKQYHYNIAKMDGNNDILIIIVGYKGSVNGYENKYFRITEKVNKIHGTKVYIFANNEHTWNDPRNCFNAIIKYVKDDNQNNKEINIKLFGVSAGATLAMYYAWEYSEIKNILLVNPPIIKENFETTINSIKMFRGNSTLIIGNKDPSYEYGKLFKQENYSNIFTNVILFDNADHNFNGLINEFINLPLQYLYNRISINI